MRNRKIIFLVFGLVLVLALAKIFFSNILSTAGLKLGGLEEQISYFERENNLLEEKTVRLSSLSRISKEAADFGFEKPSLVVNLTSEIPVAQR